MAQTLKFGNGNFATKAGSTLCYDDQNGNFKPIPMDFTRASTATRVNKQGLIEVVKSNVPRIDYTDTTNGVLLLEKAATNLQTYSSDLASVYVPTNITQTSNYGISPDGSLTSTRVVLSNLTDSRSVETLSGVLTNNTVYTFSCYYKGVKGESTYMYFLSSAGGTNISKEIIFTGKWQRESITFTAGSASNYTYIVDVRQGVSTATDFEVWGGQVEVGNASSYIPTQGSATTRVAETASGAGNSEVFNDSEGVLFADIAALENLTTQEIAFSISDGVNNRLLVRFKTDGRIGFVAFTNGVGLRALGETGVLNQSINKKIAIKYKENDYALWINGIEVVTDTTSTTFSLGALTEISFNQGNNSNPFYGKTKEIGYYNTILTDLELEYLTSYRSWESMVNELNLNIIYNG